MRVDIYQRSGPNGSISYLVVPEGRRIPEEATSTDWQTSANGMDIDENTDDLQMLSIRAPAQQIDQKGYAITSMY